ncbi:MAG: Lrp/AsnC family transcriptional regulator [Calditrichaeota bacterium]|nr:MAG: Lrp/AsnC family transcriptional regulator [Calditrichota bacterium]
MSDKIDDIDVRLLEILQKRGRMKRNELAERVGLTTPAVSERMRKMEEKGIIKGYGAVTDARKLHLDMTAFIFVISESSRFYPSIIRQAENEVEIQECHAITGGGSHLLKVRTRNTASLEKLLGRIQSWQGVLSTRTNIVLSSPKETTAVTLAHLKNRQKEDE